MNPDEIGIVLKKLENELHQLILQESKNKKRVEIERSVYNTRRLGIEYLRNQYSGTKGE